MKQQPPEWDRAWRHEQLARDERAEREAQFRRREAVKRIAGDIMIIGAFAAFAWSMMPV